MLTSVYFLHLKTVYKKTKRQFWFGRLAALPGVQHQHLLVLVERSFIMQLINQRV